MTEPMTDTQVVEAMNGEVCAICGCAKRASLPFCATDYAALPLPMRLALANPAQRLESFRSARIHLELNRERRLQFNDWPHASDDDLYAAGFRWREHKRCEAPGCGMWISIWRSPNGHLIALDRFTRQPHRRQCAAPDHFRRQREQREEAKRVAKLQTSARRRKA